jgi:NAD(P)-dependent dehydrogenase (short-subunit alcohol dehydrogenase family)
MDNEQPFRLDGRTALVTGAGRGLGRAIATTLAAAGADLLCAYDRDAEAATAVASGICEHGGKARIVNINVTDVEKIATTIDALRVEGTTVDVLVNNAGIRPSSKIADVTPEEWDTVIAVNLRGPFFLSQAVLPDMRHQGWGRIINISGMDAFRGGVRRPHVAASKVGLSGLTRALANETAIHGVTVNTVVPGMLDTQRYHPEWSAGLAAMREEELSTIPMGRPGQPTEVAYTCLFLGSDQASYITGQELFVSGGAYPLVRQRSREEAR